MNTYRLKQKSIGFILALFTIGSAFAQKQISNSYFRHLRYNHVSPYIKIAGIYPIDKATASSTSHYVFSYNDKKQLIQITNNHYFTERMHPLATIGAFKTIITYQKNTETRIYVNKNDQRVSNDRGVFKEVFTKNKKGNYSKLDFFDADDKPMESNWGIASYSWSKHRKMIVEKRVNLKGEPMNISPYFEFGTIGIRLRKDGTPQVTYNLNDAHKATNNSVGVASYQDTYDNLGNHITYSYHDQNDLRVMSPFGLSIGLKVYDTVGNYIQQKQFDTNNTFLRERSIANNQYVTLSAKASQKDTLEIKRISLGYLIALQDLKTELMAEVMNDSLHKATVGFSRELRKEVVYAIDKKRMIENATNWNKSNTRFPPKPSNEVTILDIYHRIATVKLFSDNWVEYLHLIKLDGKWSIANLLWQQKNVSQYPF